MLRAREKCPQFAPEFKVEICWCRESTDGVRVIATTLNSVNRELLHEIGCELEHRSNLKLQTPRIQTIFTLLTAMRSGSLRPSLMVDMSFTTHREDISARFIQHPQFLFGVGLKSATA